LDRFAQGTTTTYYSLATLMSAKGGVDQE
jgi:hypothetical protein